MWCNPVDGHLLFIWLNCACYFKYWLVDNHFILRFLSSNFLAPPNFISTIETLFFNKIHQCILTCGMQQQLLELPTSSPFKSLLTSASNLFDIFLVYSFQVSSHLSCFSLFFCIYINTLQWYLPYVFYTVVVATLWPILKISFLTQQNWQNFV